MTDLEHAGKRGGDVAYTIFFGCIVMVLVVYFFGGQV